MSESKAVLQLSKRNKPFVIVGSCIYMFFLAGNGTALGISQKFLLEKLNALNLFSLATILIALGTSIMTPIGGKLGEMYGRRNLMVASGIIALVLYTTVGVVYSTNATVYLILIVINGLAKGAFTATCYVLMSIVSEKKEVPKMMGFLASSIAAGTLISSLISGVFNDMQQTELGIIISSSVILVGVVLLYIGLPNTKTETHTKMDLTGILLLVVSLSAFVFSFNFGSLLGWTSPIILFGFLTLVIFVILLYKHEQKLEDNNGNPIINVSLFKNKEYVAVLVLGIALYFYQVVMTNYGTLAAIDIAGVNATVASTLTIPRTILTLILPTIAGTWIAKKRSNSWLAMAIATGSLVVAFVPLIFISPSTPIIMFFIAFTITGVSESFRAVSTVPAAQETLSSDQISNGTSLVSFVNTLAPVLSSTLLGAVFNAANGDLVVGMRNIMVTTVIVSLLGFLLVILYIRKKQLERYKNL